MSKINQRKATDYLPDPRNANKGTERGQYMIDQSVADTGLGRSIVVAADGTVMAGNKTLQAAIDAGLVDVIEVETDGKQLVVVKRTDWDGIEDEQARRYAYFDNRASEVGLAWDVEAILADLDNGVDFSAMFHEDELNLMLAALDKGEPWNPPKTFDGTDGIQEALGYGLQSIWYDLPRVNDVYPYMLNLPTRPIKGDNPTVKYGYSRTNSSETERIVKTYMRPGDLFYEMCCGWMTFSSTAKYYGFSGKGGDIWDVSLEFCKRQINAMPGAGTVTVERADCRYTGEDHESFDFVHSNPPFFDLEPYGDSESDLASAGSYERWLDAMADMGAEAARILKPGGLANFVINDFREEGNLKLMHADFISAILRTSGLVLHDFVIAEVISQSLRFRKKAFDLRRTVKCHEYVITFKKPTVRKVQS